MPKYCVAFFCLISLASAAEPPKLRLGDDVQPRRYRLDLTLIPEQDTFTGDCCSCQEPPTRTMS